MANIPQKSNDPTEEALSAIQEALDVGLMSPRAAAGSEERQAPASAIPDLFNEPSPEAAWATSDAIPRRAANDDRASIGHILQTLRRRPTRTPYIIASAAAFIWAIGGLATAYLSGAELEALLATPHIGLPAAIGIACAIGMPAIFFYVIAHMFSRSQDMRQVAESLAEVAMRLAQPETSARESIVTVGQAVRREVTAMGDGVERALARAAELEALVHNEVSALERAYNDNEVRIRDLLSELTNQRETLVNHNEQGAQRHVGASTSILPTTSPRSAIWSPTRSTRWRSASPARSPKRASTSRWRQTRIVFHRAGAERVHALIDGIVPGGHANEVANDIDFAYFRHTFQIVVSQKLLRHNLGDRLLVNIERRQTIADAARLRALEDQSLVRVDVGSNFGDIRFHINCRIFVWRLFRSDLSLNVIKEPSPSTSASISAREFISVTQTRKSLGRSG